MLTAIACCDGLNCRFAAALGVAALQSLRDHAVHGRLLLPAAAMLEARLQAESLIITMNWSYMGQALQHCKAQNARRHAQA